MRCAENLATSHSDYSHLIVIALKLTQCISYEVNHTCVQLSVSGCMLLPKHLNSMSADATPAKILSRLNLSNHVGILRYIITGAGSSASSTLLSLKPELSEMGPLPQ